MDSSTRNILEALKDRLEGCESFTPAQLMAAEIGMLQIDSNTLNVHNAAVLATDLQGVGYLWGLVEMTSHALFFSGCVESPVAANGVLERAVCAFINDHPHPTEVADDNYFFNIQEVADTLASC